MRISALAAVLGGLLSAGLMSSGLALEASAQQAPPASPPASDVIVPAAPPVADEPPKVEHIDPTAGLRSSMGRAPEGVKRVSPGALLLASFDRNFDGKVTREEIGASAAGVFAVADANKDGKITAFEQADWAASVGSQGEVLANPMMFDANLDHGVTPDEFSKGLLRLADEVMGPQNTQIAFVDLIRPLALPNDREARAPVATSRPASGNQVSPSVVGH
jgi:EF hand domain-containing protein